MQLNVRLNDGAPLPHHAHTGDAGLDLTSREGILIPPHSIKTVKTGVHVEIPNGCVGLLFPRSSCAKRGVTLANSVGVIDSGYRGEIHLQLYNLNPDDDIRIMRGERLCQLVIVPFMPCECVGVRELGETERGDDGLGSTGSM